MIGVGLTLPNYRGTASAANIVETAERADRLGFHSVWVADHIIIPLSYGPTMGSTLYETHTTLSVVAARTQHIKLGCSVMPTPYRHPLLQAKSLATLDQFSGGRVIYGGATGYMEDEFHALGIDFAQRAAITDEYVQVLKLAWTSRGPDVSWPVRRLRGHDVAIRSRCRSRIRRSGWAATATARFGASPAWPTAGTGCLAAVPVRDARSRRLRTSPRGSQRLHQIAEREGRDPASITLSIKASCQIGADDPRPFHGSAAKIVDSLGQMEQLGLELVVLAPNLLAEPTSLDVVDQLASADVRLARAVVRRNA